MFALLQLCIQSLPSPMNIPYFLLGMSMGSPRQAAWSASTFSFRSKWKKKKKSIILIYRHIHLYWRCLLLLMLTCQNDNYFYIEVVLTKPIISLKSTGGSKFQWSFIMKHMKNWLQNWTLGTAGYYKYLLHSYPEGRTNVFYIEAK